MAEIFISYRRDDTGILCERITNRLSARFGARRVFRDAIAIYVGASWEQVLHTALQDCYVVIALIGPDWLTARDAQGKRRLFDPHDFVRMELATALTQGKRIIPVLVNGTRMPQAHELPPDLAPLAQIPPLALRPDPSFDGDMRAIIQAATPGVRRRVPHLAVAICGLLGVVGAASLLASANVPHGLLATALFNVYLLGLVALLLGGALIIAQSLTARSWLWLALAVIVSALTLMSAAGAFAEYTLGDTVREQPFALLGAFSQPFALGLALVFGFFGPHRLSALGSAQQWLRSYRWIVGACATLASGLMMALIAISVFNLDTPAVLYLAGMLAAMVISLAGLALALISTLSRGRWGNVALLALLAICGVVSFEIFSDALVSHLYTVVTLFLWLGAATCALDYFALRGDWAELRKR